MTGEFVSCVWENAFKNLLVSSSILSTWHPFSIPLSSFLAFLWFNSQMWHWNALIFFVAISLGMLLNSDNSAISRLEECLKYNIKSLLYSKHNLAMTKNLKILFAAINSRIFRPFKKIVGPKFWEQFSIKICCFRCPLAEINSRWLKSATNPSRGCRNWASSEFKMSVPVASPIRFKTLFFKKIY